MKVRILSDGSAYVVQVKKWWWPFWRRDQSEYNGTRHISFTNIDHAIKYVAATILKPVPPKPKWSVARRHEEIVERVARVHGVTGSTSRCVELPEAQTQSQPG